MLKPHRLVGPVLTHRLVVPGIPHRLVVPGIPHRLVVPGLVVQGLVVPGLVVQGLVVPGYWSQSLVGVSVSPIDTLRLIFPARFVSHSGKTVIMVQASRVIGPGHGVPGCHRGRCGRWVVPGYWVLGYGVQGGAGTGYRGTGTVGPSLAVQWVPA